MCLINGNNWTGAAGSQHPELLALSSSDVGLGAAKCAQRGTLPQDPMLTVSVTMQLMD